LFIFVFDLKNIRIILLFPLSILYGLILGIRNFLFDKNIFHSQTFSFPVISIGNLNLGGVGKTPHIEYLINLLKNDYNIATLSRGYKRKTKGFVIANAKSSVEDIGDEPLQFKHKFKNIVVAVDEKRVNGIIKIKELKPETNLILLDDAYQHRKVQPGFNILVTDYNKMYTSDYVFPSGELREFRSGSDRADIIIVSKTKKDLSLSDKNKVIKVLKPKFYQKVYFTYIEYGGLIPFTTKSKELLHNFDKTYSILLFTGISNAIPLKNKLEKEYSSLTHIKFPDHHNFNLSDINQIKERFIVMKENNKIIITTEKDIMRLSLPKNLAEIQDIPIFYIPIEIKFHGNDKTEFDTQILDYVKTNSRN
jgi:tetraacyldisaccharide 4'-kinase